MLKAADHVSLWNDDVEEDLVEEYSTAAGTVHLTSMAAEETGHVDNAVAAVAEAYYY